MRFAISAIALLACTSLASAADLNGSSYGVSLKDDYVAPVYNWTGLYVGGHVGYAWGDWNGETCTSGACPGDIWEDPTVGASIDGWLGGLQVGANQQFSSFVVGIEADASWGDLGGSDSITTKKGSVEWIEDLSIDVFGTVRGRLGFLITPQLLIYGTGGLAWAKTDLKHTVWHHENKAPYDAITGRASTSEHHIGWAAGVGGEWMLSRNLTVRAEWVHVDLGDTHYHPDGKTYNFSTGDESGRLRSDQLNNVDIKFDVFRVGVNYKFGN